jgi:hypothetical protein
MFTAYHGYVRGLTWIGALTAWYQPRRPEVWATRAAGAPQRSLPRSGYGQVHRPRYCARDHEAVKGRMGSADAEAAGSRARHARQPAQPADPAAAELEGFLRHEEDTSRARRTGAGFDCLP